MEVKNWQSTISDAHTRLLTQPKCKQVEVALPNAPISATVYRNGKFTYYMRFVDINGKRCRLKLGNQDTPDYQVLSKIDVVQNELKLGLVPINTPMSLSAFFECAYMPWARQAKKSYADDASRFKNHIEKRLGNMLISRITQRNITDIMLSMNEHTPATRNRVLALFKTIFRQAQLWNAANSNPVAQLKFEREDNTINHVMSTADIERLLSVSKEQGFNDLADIFLLQASLGLRISEVLSLTFADVDYENNRITIMRSKSGTRVLPMPSHIKVVLIGRQMKHSNTLWAFPSPKNLMKHRATPSRQIDAVRKLTGLMNFKTHDLRRWFASTAANNGATLFEVSSALGHNSTQVTQERYAFVNTNTLLTVFNTVSNVLNVKETV